ncbi:Tht1-like nuclear fusion protein-domain-containing protein [Tirmania nivea]|nr:Tht1-like nuclear fusion protein-domain-containing protein [Tirmania nivea]
MGRPSPMFFCQVVVLNLILFQVPVVRSSGSAWSFLTSSSTKPHGIVAAGIDVRHAPQSLLPSMSPSVSDPYLSKSAGPSHNEALKLLRALGSRSSCHGEATSSLLVDCAALEGDALDVNVKISYAVRLAICEFKSTGVSYPSECKKLGSAGPSAYTTTLVRQKCIKKLEEKPQHWTTLSNNIQNAVALCAAARHEIDKEELLLLHTNITKIQQGLFNAVHTQLNEALEAMQAQRMWDAELKASQQDALDTLHRLKESAINTLRGSSDKASSIIEELAKQLLSSKESSNVLSDELKNVCIKRARNILR